MSSHARTVRDYWRLADERDWDGFAALFTADVVYDMPQTRERIRGRDAFVQFNAEYPGDWHLSIRRLVADDSSASTLVDFVVGGEAMTGLSFFSFAEDGSIAMIEDYWPEPYDPPAGREHLVERY